MDSKPYKQPELIRNSANAFKKPMYGWVEPRIEYFFPPPRRSKWRIIVGSVVGGLVVIAAGVGFFCWLQRRRAVNVQRAELP